LLGKRPFDDDCMRCLLLLSCLGFSISIGVLEERSVHAAEPPAADRTRAAALFDQAVEAYENHDWSVAADYFEQADACVSSSAATEYAIRSRAKASQLDRALTLAALAQARYPAPSPVAALYAELLKRWSASLHRVDFDCSASCTLDVDGKAISSFPARTGTLYLALGQHTLLAHLGTTASAQRSVVAIEGGSLRLAFTPAAPKAAAPRSRAVERVPDHGTADTGWSPAIFWAGVGVTTLATGASIWSGVDALKHPGTDRVRSECAASDTSCPTYLEGLAHQRRTNYLIGTSAVLGISTAAVGILFTDWGARSTPRQAGLDVWRPTGRRASSLHINPSVLPDGRIYLEFRGGF
jgi:hypothetical protein